MEKRTRNILIGVAVVGGTLGFLYWRSKENEAKGNALLDFINESITQNDLSKATDEGISKVQSTAIDPNKLKIGTLSGSYKDPRISKMLSKVNSDLWAAMKGGGTDINQFMKAFTQIKSKNTMAMVDQVFKNSPLGGGKGLFENMKAETALNNSQYGQFGDKTSGVLNAIPGINAYWHPLIGKYLNSLPQY